MHDERHDLGLPRKGLVIPIDQVDDDFVLARRQVLHVSCGDRLHR